MMKRNLHKIYDIILKIIISLYLKEFLEYIGEKREIIEVLQTEITTLNGRTRILDFLCTLEDNTLCHVEFQFPVAYTDDLDRFFNYNITAQVHYDNLVDTIIFNFTESHQGNREISIGKSKKFEPLTFYLGDMDFEHELEKINVKLGLNLLEKIINTNRTNIKLTYREELHLLLMSLAPKYKHKKKLLKPIVGLLKNEKIFHEEKINGIRSIIQLEIDNLLTPEEQNEFKGEIDMTDETIEIISQAVKEVNRKYEQEAIDEARKEGIKEGKKEGIKEGKKEGIKEIAKKLKKIHTPEEISKITGLSLNTILLL